MRTAHMHGERTQVCLKLHRLGRTCFRNVKNKRDYIMMKDRAKNLAPADEEPKYAE